MTRSTWKPHFFDVSLHKKLENVDLNLKKKGMSKVRTWSRRSTILKDWIGHKLEVYNGLKFIPITIREEMVHHKLGEFVFTRKRAVHKKKTIKKKK
jgi:small subunit ribosomal protein S19